MNIQIEPGEWGEACIEEIQRLLEDVAAQLLRHLDDPPEGRIRVQCRPKETPRILYRTSADQDYVIWLTVQGRLWSKFAYQFSHELCHLVSDYERLRQTANQWFHESLCELASLFTLKQMATTWEKSAPYPNWLVYASALDSYAVDIISQDRHQLPSGVSLMEWFRVNEARLRADPYQRPLNSLVAIQLLPLLQFSPTHWESIRHMPDTAESFQIFLSLWRDSCPLAHQSFIRQVAEAFQVPLT